MEGWRFKQQIGLSSWMAMRESPGCAGKGLGVMSGHSVRAGLFFACGTSGVVLSEMD